MPPFDDRLVEIIYKHSGVKHSTALRLAQRIRDEGLLVEGIAPAKLRAAEAMYEALKEMLAELEQTKGISLVWLNKWRQVLVKAEGKEEIMDKDMANAPMIHSDKPVGRLVGTGIRIVAVDKITGLAVFSGVQLNNTTMEIEALPSLYVWVEKISPQDGAK